MSREERTSVTPPPGSPDSMAESTDEAIGLGKAEPGIEDHLVPKEFTETNQQDKFPAFQKHYKPVLQKAKSFTAAEQTKEAVGQEDIAVVIERLKTAESPLSLSEARQRRASIKQERRESIELIRNRTAFRLSQSRRGSLEEQSTHNS